MAKNPVKKPKKTLWLSLAVVVVAVIGVLTLGKKIEKRFDPKMPEQSVIILNDVNYAKGKTLLAALKNRRSVREYSETPISLDDLSGILWAANGLNRPEENKHTAPTARNIQNMEIYAFTQQGVFLYNAKTHKLTRIKETDERAKAGLQEFVKTAPLNLVIVATYGKMQNATRAHDEAMALIGAGYISQNIYLYASAFNMETVARAMIDKAALKEVLNLSENQEALLAHSVGYPKIREESAK